MPVLIGEIIAEVEPPLVTPQENQAPETYMPVSDPEHELLKTLTLIEERRARLSID